MTEKICAGIVLFNPEVRRLEENLKQINHQVESIIIIDNASENIKEIEDLITEWSNIVLLKNSKNEGVAFALNQIINFGLENRYNWILTLDQDSVCEDQLIDSYLKFVREHPYMLIGCLTCNIIDRNFKLNHKYEQAEYKEVKYCITSGSLMNIPATLKVGGFDSSMFIDKVDCDICIRLKKNNYKIIQINYDGLLHEVGNAVQLNLGFRKWELYNHSPSRRYYMCRNASYLLYKYHNGYVLKIFVKEIFHTILVFVFESNRCKKLATSIKGFKDGFK